MATKEGLVKKTSLAEYRNIRKGGLRAAILREEDEIINVGLAQEGRTTILIAHNYSATVFADQVIVLCDGQIQACGAPEELLRTNDYYRTFARQAAETAK